jgi:hypothetical protein
MITLTLGAGIANWVHPTLSRMPRVLYLHANSDDYLADSLLHGLRTVLGADVVDSPRRDGLYQGLSPERLRRAYGRGFTLYGRLPEIDVDRRWALSRARDGAFDVVVIAEIHRDWSPWAALRPHARRLRERGCQVVVVDGGFSPAMYPYGPTWWRQMRPWPLPRAHGRVPFFKRELQPLTARLRFGGLLPASIGMRLLTRNVRPIAFSIPEEHLATGDEPKTKRLATHVVDPEVAELVPAAAQGYAFDREADYYADLRTSRFGVTTKKAAWDCMRHYELAASGCVPCFRHLDRKPPLAGPFGLDETNCVTYSDARELLERLERIDDTEYGRLRSGALRWARANTTRQRALEFLDAVGHPVKPPGEATRAPGLDLRPSV